MEQTGKRNPELDDVFVLADTFDGFLKLIRERRSCAFEVDAGSVVARVMQLARSASSNAWEVRCSGCHHRMSLGRFVLPAIGVGHSGATATCPVCGSGNYTLIFHYVDPQGIGLADVEALRALWKARARKWWDSPDPWFGEPPPVGEDVIRIASSKDYCYCSGCNSPIPRGEGYLVGGISDGTFYCGACIDAKLGQDPVGKLRADPQYFGQGEIPLARTFARTQRITPEWRTEPPLGREMREDVKGKRPWWRRLVGWLFRKPCG